MVYLKEFRVYSIYFINYRILFQGSQVLSGGGGVCVLERGL